MRNPLARYYDFAVQPRHGYYTRLWLALPAGASVLLMFVIAWCARHGIVTDPAVLRTLQAAVLAPVPIWLIYVAYRLACDAIAAARWLGRAMEPSWRSGWRGAWRTLFGRSGKSG